MKTVSRALVLLSCLATTSVGAEDAAKQRLDALIASYKALPAYADHGEVTLVVKVGERTLKQVSQASLSFSKPNKLDVRTEFVRIVSDGATLTTVVVPLKKFQTTAVPRKFTEAALRGGPLGAIEFGGVAGLPIVHVLNLVIGDNPARLIEDFAPKLLAEPDMMVEGTSYQVLRLDEADNDDWRFLIDPKTGLLAFVDLVIEGGCHEVVDCRFGHPCRFPPMVCRRRLDHRPKGRSVRLHCAGRIHRRRQARRGCRQGRR